MLEQIGKIFFTLRTYYQAGLAVARQSSTEKIIAVQNQKLRRLVRYCFDNVKYYRELFETEGIKPEQVQSPADLWKIPFLTKEQLRNRFWDFLPTDLPPCRVSRTSGSTGVPVCILSDPNSRMFNSAGVIRQRHASGITFFGGAILTPLKNDSESPKDPHWTFLQGLHKTFYINPYIDSSENIEYVRRLLAKLREPAVIGITPAVSGLQNT